MKEHLKKYSVGELRDFVRGEIAGLRGYSKMKRAELEDLIITEHEDSGKFAKLLKKERVEAAIVASGKELKDARKRVREVLKLPKKEQLKGLKGKLQKQLYRKAVRTGRGV